MNTTKITTPSTTNVLIVVLLSLVIYTGVIIYFFNTIVALSVFLFGPIGLLIAGCVLMFVCFSGRADKYFHAVFNFIINTVERVVGCVERAAKKVYSFFQFRKSVTA